jgi:hypothetical protein
MDEDSNDSSDDEDNNAEVQLLREQVIQLQEILATMQQELATATNLMGQQAAQNANLQAQAQAVAHGREPGQLLKPPPPEMFDGTQDKLQGFVTQLRVYFNYFPVTLNTNERRVTYAHSRLKGNALNWFEPVMREYLNGQGTERTMNIITNFDHFVRVLQETFGIQDEKRKSEHEINLLSQTGSCSTFSTRYLQLLAKTGWDHEHAMSHYFDRLKKEVQEELYKEDRPASIHDYMTMAIRIDDRQYQWRTRKQRPTHYANTGKPRQQRTAVSGTHAGPMELGAVEKRKCYNCNEVGHISPQCPKPKKQRNWKPAKEGKKQLGAIGKTETKTLGMVRKVTQEEKPTKAVIPGFSMPPTPAFKKILEPGERWDRKVSRENQRKIAQIFRELKQKYEQGKRILEFGPPTKYEYTFFYNNGIIPHNPMEKERYVFTKAEIEAELNELHAYHQKKMEEQNPERERGLVLFGRNTTEAIRYNDNGYDVPTCMKTTGTHDHPEESWMTCYDIWCQTHWKSKVENDFFPFPNGKIPTKYDAIQTIRFTHRRYGMGPYAIFEEDLEEYPIECTFEKLPAEHCRELLCEVHKEDKIRMWHEEKCREDQATYACNSQIERCNDWKCRNHLEAKQEALELGRYGDDDMNAAKLHLQQHQLWEEQLRKCRLEGQSSPTTSEGSSEMEEQGITSTDEKEWTAGHSEEETAFDPESNKVSEWMKKCHQYVPKDARYPSTLEELFSHVPRNANWYKYLEERVNQAKNDRNRL